MRGVEEKCSSDETAKIVILYYKYLLFYIIIILFFLVAVRRTGKEATATCTRSRERGRLLLIHVADFGTVSFSLSLTLSIYIYLVSWLFTSHPMSNNNFYSSSPSSPYRTSPRRGGGYRDHFDADFFEEESTGVVGIHRNSGLAGGDTPAAAAPYGDLMLDVTLESSSAGRRGGLDGAELDNEINNLYTTNPSQIHKVRFGSRRHRRSRLYMYLFLGMSLLFLILFVSIRSSKDKNNEASATKTVPAIPDDEIDNFYEDIDNQPTFVGGNGSGSGGGGKSPHVETCAFVHHPYDPVKSCRDTTDCTCRDTSFPLKPNAREEPAWASLWQGAYDRNLHLVLQAEQYPPKMVVYGDEFVEHFLGTSVGLHKSNLEPTMMSFANLFGNQALPLGITADRTENLLWRIKEGGELPPELQPKVFWIVIGKNNFQLDRCNTDFTASGIRAVAKFLHDARPNAHVVINSLLPRGDSQQLYFQEQFEAINRNLECFSKESGRYHFFNASDIFLQPNGLLDLSLMMPDGQHPNGVGAQYWVEELQLFTEFHIDSRLWNP